MSRKKSAWGRRKPPWYGRTPTARADRLEALLGKKKKFRVRPTEEKLFVREEIEAITGMVKSGALSTPEALRLMGYELEEEKES